jgi:hypothetical protein
MQYKETDKKCEDFDEFLLELQESIMMGQRGGSHPVILFYDEHKNEIVAYHTFFKLCR